jgi:prepilin-type processing-associated H-X9-DG protein
MTDPMHEQLLGHLLGALDDDEQEWLEARLKTDGEYRRHCLLWRRRLGAIEAALPEFEPPPGLAERTCRLVAACAPAMVTLPGPRPRGKMTPEAVFPARAATIAWRDMATLTFLGVMALILIFPAIYGSRFHARLAACQANLRQFGLALAEYGQHQGEDISRLATGGGLTPAGLFAAQRIEDDFVADRGQALCPDAWLAAQGIHVSGANVSGTRRVPLYVAGTLRVPYYVAGTLRAPPAEHSIDHTNRTNDWSGTWRDGTSGGGQAPPLPAALPFLADAPSADLPGQSIDAHEGRGRNVFFADGQVRFLPCSAPADAAETFLSGRDSFTAPDGSRPVTFVTWH